ncbi:hypothetical protein E3N88_19396 [Mikania micrantha]|uniref:Uncharacterized protein n=1 Tax=Mikania micrantha TaxID=192012 RepID=A0A5N6NPQ6_9ASTR|nr:hypothetical protein E3N88_19396 [Mikania micrantha]
MFLWSNGCCFVFDAHIPGSNPGRRSSAIKVAVLELRRTEGVRLESRSVVEVAVAVGGGGSRSAKEFGWSRSGWNLLSIAILCGILERRLIMPRASDGGAPPPAASGFRSASHLRSAQLCASRLKRH